jgi:hypothetical protein
MNNDLHYIEEPCLSVAWARAFLQLLKPRSGKEIVPLVVSITGFEENQPTEDPTIRSALDETLHNLRKQSCQTVASTIFPVSLWNPGVPRSQLYERYTRIVPKLKKTRHINRRGLYFERLTSGGTPGRENQLEFVIGNFTARQGVRRSALQVAVFDPRRDHSTAAQAGFPCLQHVTFAFYATQYHVERAYGNYLGLCGLGRFVAHELGCRLVRVTCFAGISLLDGSKKQLADLALVVESSLSACTHQTT